MCFRNTNYGKVSINTTIYNKIIQSIDVQIVFYCSMFRSNDHHQAVVMNEANTVIELSPIWIHISYMCTCCEIKLLLKFAINLRIKLTGNNHVKIGVECEDYEV